MIILVTNDDGDSEGLRSLVEAGAKFGDIYAIVPNRQRSAISRAITLHKPIRIHKITNEISSINGTPADCVLFSLNCGEFVKPDLILSGINWGDNTCLGPLIGSGTIGACWQAVLDGIPSIAFSVHKEGHDWHKKESWGSRKELVQTVSRVIEELKPKLKDSSFFSVNLPEKHVGAEIVYTHKFQKRKYRTVIEKRKDPNGVPYFWIGGELEEVKEETDLHEVVVNNKITISEVSLSIFKSD